LAADVITYPALFANAGRRATEEAKQSLSEAAQEMKPSATETAQRIADVGKLPGGRSPKAAATERTTATIAQEVHAH
jgi:hypothetical protein